MKRSSLTALLLLVPVPTIGVLAAMYFLADTALGKSIFSFSKLWILLLPLIWIKFVDRKRWSWSKPRHGGMVAGLLSGLVISGIIVAAYVFFAASQIDADSVKDMAGRVGLSDPRVYIGAALYWVLVNSVLEEYVWRWFVVEKMEESGARGWAIPLSALAFTLHHIVALNVYFTPTIVFLCSAGIFAGGAIWSWFYRKYHSIWPGYLSHALVDIAVFGIGYWLIFLEA